MNNNNYNIYNHNGEEAVNIIIKNTNFNISDDAVKAAIMKKTLSHSYEDVRMWSCVRLPALPEEEFSDYDFELEIEYLTFPLYRVQEFCKLPETELDEIEKDDADRYKNAVRLYEESRDKVIKFKDDFVESLTAQDLVDIFDNMDCRFDGWCTPPMKMLHEYANLI